MGNPPKARRPTLGWWSLALGLAGFLTCGLAAIAGLGCGYIAVLRDRRRVVPWLGMAFSLVAILTWVSVALLVWLSWRAGSETWRETSQMLRLGPARAWASYEPSLIIESDGDQGPFGGWCHIHWQAVDKNTFTREAIIAFAKKKGFPLLAEHRFSAAEVGGWADARGKPGFPLDGSGFDPVEQPYYPDRFPRQISTAATVLEFESGWLLIPGGGPEEFPANVCLMIGEDGRQMSLYHMWGE